MRHIGTQTLTTERLTLRRFTADDAEYMFYNWASDPQVTKYLTWPAHTDVAAAQEILAQWETEYEKEDCYRWAIEHNETEQPIGAVEVTRIDERAECMKVAFCIGKKHWRQGYATEALTEVMRFLFEEVGANRVWGACNVENVNAAKVMEACGMDSEGTLRQHGRENAGVVDLAVYGAVRSAGEAAYEDEETEAPGAAVTKVVSGDGTVRNVISDETMEYVGILAKLELSPAEAEAAKKDMEEMLDYIDQLNELDTEGVEPMSHVFPVHNVFREDVVANGDGSKDTLSNAPLQKDGGFKVPKTIGE